MSTTNTFFQDADDLSVDQMNIQHDSGTRYDQSVANVTNVREGGDDTVVHHDNSRRNTTHVHYGDSYNTTNNNYGPVKNYHGPVHKYGAGSSVFNTNTFDNSTAVFYAATGSDVAATPAIPRRDLHLTDPEAVEAPGQLPQLSSPAQPPYNPDGIARGNVQRQHDSVSITGSPAMNEPAHSGPPSLAGTSRLNPWTKYYPKDKSACLDQGTLFPGAPSTHALQDDDDDWEDDDRGADGASVKAPQDTLTRCTDEEEGSQVGISWTK